MLHNLKQYFICFFFLINKVLFSTYQINNYNNATSTQKYKIENYFNKKSAKHFCFALFSICIGFILRPLRQVPLQACSEHHQEQVHMLKATL